MENPFSGSLRLLVLLMLVLTGGCASLSPESQQSETVRPEWTQELPAKTIVPAFTILQSEKAYNRIGFVEAVEDKEKTEVRVNPEKPVIYLASSQFTTERGEYFNDVYRVHFEKTPFSLVPFYLTMGKHPGLLVILTRDRDNHLILVTTAHTCGCYAVSIPTGWLSRGSFPPNWPETEIHVYGETLPARLPEVVPGQLIELVIRPGVHRVMDIRVIDESDLSNCTSVTAAVHSQDSLRRLKTRTGKETSFYYRNQPLTGYVKGAFKWWEMLLLSVPSLDLFVGMDKDFGTTEQTGTPFYTSLQPWYRSASDMNDFSSFLKFHGWNF